MSAESTRELQRFGKLLMRLVRDRAIAACDRLASGEMVGPDGERWRTVLSTTDAREAVMNLIPDVVDQTLFELLNAVDNGEFPLAWRQSDGSLVGLDHLGLGEMAGWLMGSPGWRHQYSSQRFFDPLQHIRLDLEGNDEFQE